MEEEDCKLFIGTDSDIGEKKEGNECKVKWTQEEVSGEKWIYFFY